MRWLVVVALAACYSPRSTRCEPCSGISECPGGLSCVSNTCQETAGACAALDDSGTEAMTPLEPGACMGVQQLPFVLICPPDMLAVQKSLPASINTSNKAECTYITEAEASTPSLCVIAAQNLAVLGETKLEGSRPLVLLARERLEISENGRLTANGVNTKPANPPQIPPGSSCVSPPGSSNLSNGAAGGGPGGSFIGRGGTGAAGNGTPATASSTPPPLPVSMRGGCRGGDGGMTNTVPGGLGGDGGGVVYLLGKTIQIDGVVNASGGGARAATGVLAGGGGGGTGGMILMWSPEPITLGSSAQVFALGGGGGEGGASAGGGVSMPGNDPVSPVLPAGTSTEGGDGGDGGGGGESTSVPDGRQGLSGGGAGGGGGGGGIGYIKTIPRLEASAKIAPDPS